MCNPQASSFKKKKDSIPAYIPIKSAIHQLHAEKGKRIVDFILTTAFHQAN